MLEIISGGQTGVDRGAMRAAHRLRYLGQPCWVPRGRKSEDGQVPEEFPVQEHESPDYPPRTWCNVRDSDKTIIIASSPPVKGSALTVRFCREQGKMFRLFDRREVLEKYEDPAWTKEWVEKILEWIGDSTKINVAGSRESSATGIERATEILFDRVLRRANTSTFTQDENSTHV